MLFPTKNHPFLVFIIERILEFTDKRLKDMEVIHIYDPTTDLSSIKKSKSKDIESQKKQGKYNNKTIIKYILGEYFNYSSEQKKSFGELTPQGKKSCERHTIDILNKNNISSDGYDIFNSVPEKATDDEDTQPFKLKLYPNRQFYLDNSLSEKITKVSNDNFKQIFEFFTKAKNEEKAILLLSTATKGLIQYLLVSGLYLIFKNTGLEQRIHARQQQSQNRQTSQKNIYKKMHISKKTTFYGYLLDKTFDHPYTFIQMLTITFKNVLTMELDDFESDSKNIYEKFLKFAWEEYKIVRSFTKNF
jgi:cell division protein FtsB